MMKPSPNETCIANTTHYTEERFASFFSSGFITAIVVNPPERKLAKRTSVHNLEIRYYVNFLGRFGSNGFQLK